MYTFARFHPTIASFSPSNFPSSAYVTMCLQTVCNWMFQRLLTSDDGIQCLKSVRNVHRSQSSKGTNPWQSNGAVSWRILTRTVCDYIDNDIAAHGAEKQPTKLVIPDIFCNAPGTERATNGMASSSSSSLRTDSNSILNPEFNERRHSESVTVAGKSPGSGQGRPRSEAAASHERLPQGVPHNGNGNPFQDDTKPVWAASSGISSPEVIQVFFSITLSTTIVNR